MSHSGGKINGSGESAPKRRRTDEVEEEKKEDGVEELENLLEQASEIEGEVEGLIAEENAEVTKVQSTFADKRLSVYARRSKIIEKIPHFWTDVVCNHFFFHLFFHYFISFEFSQLLVDE